MSALIYKSPEMRMGYTTPINNQDDLMVSWKTKVETTLEQYARNRTALLPCLEIIQKFSGYITPESVSYLRDSLNIPATDIYGVASFYGMLTTTRKGKYVVRLCNSLSCNINASHHLLGYIENILGIKPRETTPDNQFTLEVVACLGLCDQAPIMMINEKIYGRLTEENIKQIFASLKDKK